MGDLLNYYSILYNFSIYSFIFGRQIKLVPVCDTSFIDRLPDVPMAL